MKPLIDAAYYLQFELFKNACLCKMATEFFGKAPTEEELLEFKNKNELPDLTRAEEEELQANYQPIFKMLEQKFRDDLTQEEK